MLYPKFQKVRNIVLFSTFGSFLVRIPKSSVGSYRYPLTLTHTQNFKILASTISIGNWWIGQSVTYFILFEDGIGIYITYTYTLCQIANKCTLEWSNTYKYRKKRSKHPKLTIYVGTIPKQKPISITILSSWAVNDKRRWIQIGVKSRLESSHLSPTVRFLCRKYKCSKL